MLLSKGHHAYSLIVDLGKQPANITVGQLIAHCPSLKRELKQRISTRTVGMLAQQPITVQGVTMKVDFHILDISEARGGYPIILGRPWLKEVKTIDYWEKCNMRIAPHMNRVNVKVIPNFKKTDNNSPEDTSDEEYDSTWTSEITTSDSESKREVDLYALNFLPQVLTSSMSHLGDLTVVPSRTRNYSILSNSAPL